VREQRLDDGYVIYDPEGWLALMKQEAPNAVLGECANCGSRDVPVYFDGEADICLDVWACHVRAEAVQLRRLIRMAS
jgi:hypothetical protein